MNLNPFAKAEAPPAPTPSRAVTLYDPLPQALPARKGSQLEKELRSKVWSGGHIGPDLARAAGLSLADLISWSHGATHITALQAAAIGSFIGVLDGPVSGLEVIRAALAAKLSGGRSADWGPSRNNRTPDRGVSQDEENPSSAAHAGRCRKFVDGDDSAMSIDELNEFVRSQYGSDSWYDPSGDVLRKTENAARIGPGPEPAKGRPISEIVGPNAERIGLCWGPPLYPRDHAPQPKPARPGWAA
jgi:hypothetical protein